MNKQDLIDQLNSHITSSNHVVLFYKLGKWTQLKTTVNLVGDRYLNIPDMNEAYFIRLNVEYLKGFLIERIRVYEATILWEWLCTKP